MANIAKHTKSRKVANYSFFLCLFVWLLYLIFFSLRFTECLCWWSDVLFIFCWNVGTIDKIFLMYTKQKQWKKCSNEINCEKYTVLDSNSCVCFFFLFQTRKKSIVEILLLIATIIALFYIAALWNFFPFFSQLWKIKSKSPIR